MKRPSLVQSLLVLILPTIVFAKTQELSDEARMLAQSLREAVKADATERVQRLIQKGAPVDVANDFGVTPLHLAAQMGHYKVAKMLVQAGANPDRVDNKDRSPLFFAARSCSPRTTLVLLSSRAAINRRSSMLQTPLMAAAEQGCDVVVEALLKEKNIDLNARDIYQKSAFDYADEFTAIPGEARTLRLLNDALGRATRRPVPTAAPKISPN